MNKDQIKEASEYAFLANVENQSEILIRFPEALILGNIEEGDFGYCAFDGEKIIVAFRGSDDKEDWIGKEGNLKTKVNTYGYHTGFFDAAHKFKKQVEDFIKDIYKRSHVTNIWWCGHSRGAAIVTMLAHECGYYRTSKVFGFGSPKVCTKKSQLYKNVQAGLLDIINVINSTDIVPRVPFTRRWEKENYVRVGKIVKIGEQLSSFTKFKLFLMELTGRIDEGYPWFDSHRPKSYIKSLENW